MVIWNELEDLRRRENAKRGYREVKTPLLYDIDTYITSGHYENYKENMFFVQGAEDEKPLALKPMNCPGHMLLFGSQLRSYRDLPLRYAESSTLHRDERGGTLHGLLRVKHITQDDAHVFVSEDQIQEEIDAMIEFARYLYDLFGLTPRAEPRRGRNTASAPTSSGTTPRRLWRRRCAATRWSTSSARGGTSTGRRSTST